MTTHKNNSVDTTSGRVLVTVKFRSAGKQYDFDAGDFKLVVHDEIVVETNKGRALGIVAKEPRYVEAGELPNDLKPVLRKATAADINMARISSTKEHEARDYCIARIKYRKIAMKLVKAEYLFDGSKIIFYFTADGRIDFRELVKDLAQYFHTRIEMRQIGVRDEAKLLGGIGICGRELCCGTFLTDFNPVSVRMAKQQGLALNPVKISGQCGRLLCCLGYEYNTYCKMAKQLPKPGSKITVDGKPAEVLSTQTLAQTLTVRCEGKVTFGITLERLGKNKQLPEQTPNINLEKQSGTEDTDAAKTRAKNGKRSGGKAAKSPNGRKNLQPSKNHQAKKSEQRGVRAKSGTEPADNRPAVGSRSPRPAREVNRGEGTAHPARAKNTPRKNRSPQSRASRGQGQNTGDNQHAQQNKSRQRGTDSAGVIASNNTVTTKDAPAIAGQNNATKPSKRRNRNRRRPQQKPKQEL